MKSRRVLMAQYALLGVPFPTLALTVGLGSPLALCITFAGPLLIMAAVVVWELKAYPI
ncbi:hypothetical protein [Streptomyces sp. W007]|uniref:hypothetical protein n=1 Tax=Streptomyces sp. W007 TaxID=1055352 RepID=UPI001300C6D5|nr:hypothetical protein [Streptomyces sp. W007]